MQEKLHDGQSHKTKTWNKIWNTTALNTIVNSLRIHTALCSRVWPECNKGWKNMFLWMGDANLCWLSMGSLFKSDLILCNGIKKQIISSEEIDTSWDISYKTPSEEILYLKEQQQQGPFFGKMSSACLALCHDQLSTAAHRSFTRPSCRFSHHHSYCRHGALSMAFFTLSSRYCWAWRDSLGIGFWLPTHSPLCFFGR